MEWVPDLIGTPPRREDNGGDQIEKTGAEKRRLVEQIETESALETESAIEIESQTQSFEIESCETESGETESGETRIGKKVQIVELVEIETES